MCAPAGIRSRPSTLKCRPQRRPSIHRHERAHPRAIAKCRRDGKKKQSAMLPPQAQADTIK